MIRRITARFTVKGMLVYSVIAALCWFSLGWIQPAAETRTIIETGTFDRVGHYDEQVQHEINELWGRIETELRKHGTVYTSDLGPPATHEEIAKLEATLGYRLPGDFKASLKVHGSAGPFLSNHSLHDTEAIAFDWDEYLDICSDPVVGPLPLNLLLLYPMLIQCIPKPAH